MSQSLLTSPFASIAIFLLLFISDSLLTVHAARLYGAGANKVIVLEGSYELNPRFSEDVDRLRALPPRFLASLGVFSLLIWAVWYLCVGLSWLPQAYPFFLGAILLVQGPIHVRHIRNIVAFHHAEHRNGIDGRIQYTRRFSLTLSAIELLSFSALYALLALLAASPLLLGGALATAMLALRSYHASAKTPSQPRPG